MAERKKLEVTILPQNFTETQQEQARKNISAAPMSDVSSLSAKTITKINGDECLSVTSARNPDGTIEYSLAVTAEPTDTRLQGKDGVYTSRVQGDEGLWAVGLSGNYLSAYDWTRANSAKTMEVNSVVDTYSADWNEASAFGANSGKFVTSGDEIADTDLAYVLKKTGDNVAWSGIDLSDLGKIYPITSITPDLVSATISTVNNIPTYVLSAKEAEPAVYYDVSANRMSAWSGIDNNINYYFLQGANISGNHGISAEYDPENNQWDIGLKTQSYSYAAARTNVTTMTATEETLSGFVDISTAGITFENDIVTLDKGLYHVDIQVNIPIDVVDDSYYDVTLTPSLSNAVLRQSIDSTYVHNTTLDLSFDINLLTDNNALTFTLAGLPVGRKYKVENFQIHEVTTIDSLIDVISGDGDCKVFIGTVESTFEDYANAMLDGKVLYLRAPLVIPGDSFPLDVLLQGPNLSFTDWPEHYGSRAEAIEEIKANFYDLRLEFRGELRLRMGVTGDYIIGYCLEIDPDSVLYPNYMYGMIGPELVLEYADSDILLDAVMPLAYDANDEVVIDKEKLCYVLSAIHQQGIPVKILTGAAELGDNYHYMMELDAGYSGSPFEMLGDIEFRATELVYMYKDDYTGDWIHMDFPNPCALRLVLQYDSNTDTNTLEPISYPQGPGFQKRYIPITLDTAWSTLYSIFTESDVPPQGVALFLSEYGIVEPLFFDFCQFYIKRNAESGYERIQIIFSFFNLQHMMFMKNGDDDAVVMYVVGNAYWDGDSISRNLNSPWTHVTGLHYDSVKNESYLTIRNRSEYRIYWNGAPSPDSATLVVSMQELPPYSIMCHSRIYCKNDSTSDVSVVIGDLTVSVPTGVWLLDISGTSNANGGQAIVTKHEAFESVNISMEFVSINI